MKKHPDQQARKKQLTSQKVDSIERPPQYPVYVTDDYNSTSFPEKVVVSNEPVLKSKKLHKDAILPTRAHKTDAGYDLYALENTTVCQNTHQLVKTGISLEIPEGYAGLIWPRSGLSYKYGLDVFAGVIDSGYRGDVGVILYNSHSSVYNVEAGDRIAQILFQKVENFQLIEVNSLDDAHRGDGGFGSTGS